ncbi:hypothetical protein [Ideonella sp. A 288]|uniref:hypothetical protein n=1 Tax=Ideonella sp. A 288 TaxID=1962181 RepID=UPI000B4B8F6E|nr:hypothetical protein [Ideonella sp. A 288]
MNWPRSTAALASGQHHDNVLQCAAGFFSSQAAALDTLDHLFERQGLRPNQALLLDPTDASRTRFARVSWRWTDRWPSEHAQSRSDRLVCAGVGAWLAGMCTLLWLVAETDTDQAMHLLWLGGATLSGALLGVGLHLLFSRPMRPVQFDRNVQRHLAEGCHAVVVHGVPARQQAEVMAVLRGRSQAWCTEALAVHRL